MPFTKQDFEELLDAAEAVSAKSGAPNFDTFAGSVRQDAFYMDAPAPVRHAVENIADHLDALAMMIRSDFPRPMGVQQAESMAHNALREENAKLNEKVAELIREAKERQGRIDELIDRAERISRQRRFWENKAIGLAEERDSLRRKLHSKGGDDE
jgi:hypothetical protein